MKNCLASLGLSVYAVFIAGLLLYSCSLPIFRQQPTSTDLDLAESYFEQGEWKKAIVEYESYLSRHPGNSLAKIKLGRSLMAEDRFEEALSEFDQVIIDGPERSSEAYLWAGRSSHQLDRFAEAERYYRQYVQYYDHADINMMDYYIEQTGAARKAGNDASNCLVENAGYLVNTIHDEFHPVYSPNVDDRFYYSIHDTERSLRIRSTPWVGASMKYAEVSQGIWKTEGALEIGLSIDQEFRLLDFSEDGQHVYFTRPAEKNDRVTFQRSFEEVPGETQIIEWDHPIFNSSLGDRDLFTIHDSAYLFSSNRLQGYGGYDLFVTFKRFGEWVVQNLGPVINGSYDEIAPFLSDNGREIYFSSNSDKSIGGYDIFFATFDDEMETWAPPQNMLPPVNSGRNDVEFRLSKDGHEALFSSDRTDGHGGYDIYHVYFDQPRSSQSDWSQPRYFYQVSAYRSFSSQDKKPQHPDEKPIFELPIINFGERPVVITPEIKDELDKILEYARLYPHVGLLLHIFTEKKIENDFSLYRPVLILNNAIDYLRENGLDMSRLQMRLYGDQYHRYTSLYSSGDQVIVPVQQSNRRVEFEFTGTENLPVRFVVGEDAVVYSKSSVSPYQEWKSITRDLYFRIQLMDADQLLKRSDFIQNEDLMLAIDGSSDYFTYYSGVFNEMEAAQEKLRAYIAQGYSDAEIVAFIGPSRIPSDQITSEMIETYPGLKKYIIYQK